MARKRTLDRRTLRDQTEAAEARERDEEEVQEAEDEEEEADESDAEEADEEEKPKAKKKPATKKPAAKKRARVKDAPRMRAVWVVFDNASKRIKEFPYPQKADAEKFLTEKQEEKKGVFYLQMVKEPIEEKPTTVSKSS
jgi:hypothetical protein